MSFRNIVRIILIALTVYYVVGAIASLVAVVFGTLLMWSQRLYDRRRIPLYLEYCRAYLDIKAERQDAKKAYYEELFDGDVGLLTRQEWRNAKLSRRKIQPEEVYARMILTGRVPEASRDEVEEKRTRNVPPTHDLWSVFPEELAAYEKGRLPGAFY